MAAAEAAAAVEAAVLAGEDTSFFVRPAEAASWAAAGTKEMVRDWGDTVEWLGNTDSAGGLGTSHTVVLGRTGVEDHWTNEGLSHREPREGNQPCARVL